MASYRTIIKDFGIIGIANVLVGSKSIILLPIISAHYGPYGYGIWSQVVVTLIILDAIAGLTLSYSFVRFFAGSERLSEVREGFYSILAFMLLWSSFIASIIYLLADPLALIILGDINLSIIIELVAMILPFFVINSLLLYYFRARQKMDRFAFFMVLQAIFEIIAVLAATVLEFDIIGVFKALLVSKASIDIIILMAIVTEIGYTIPNFQNITGHLKFSVPLIPTQISQWTITSSDRYLIGHFLGVSSVGIYSAAYTLGSLLSFLSIPISIILVPILVKSYDKGDFDHVKSVLSLTVRYSSLIAIPLVFGISVLSQAILSVIAGSAFADSGTIVVPIVSACMLLMMYNTIMCQAIMLIKKTTIVGAIWISSSILNLGLNIVFIPAWGLVGAAATTLVTFSVVTTITTYYSLRTINFDLQGTFIVKSVISSIVMCLPILLLYPSNTIEIIGVTVTGASIYFLALILMKCFTREELTCAKRLLIDLVPERL